MKITKEHIIQGSLALFVLSTVGLLGFQAHKILDSSEYQYYYKYYSDMKTQLPSAVGKIPVLSVLSLQRDKETGDFDKYNKALLQAATKNAANLTAYSVSYGVTLSCGDTEALLFGDPNRIEISLMLNRKDSVSSGNLCFESRLDEVQPLSIPLYIDHGATKDTVYMKINNTWYKTMTEQKLDVLKSPHELLLDNADIRLVDAPYFLAGAHLYASMQDYNEGPFAFISPSSCDNSNDAHSKLILQIDPNNQLVDIACNSTDLPINMDAVSQHLNENKDPILEFLFNNYQIRTMDARTRFFYGEVDSIIIPEEALAADTISMFTHNTVTDYLMKYIDNYARAAGFIENWGEYNE